MNVAGIDPSLRCCAVARPNGELLLLKSDLTGFPRLCQLRDTVLAVCDDDAVERVVIEGYTFGTTHSAHVLGELGGVIRAGLHDRHIPWIDIPPGTLKKYATGSGRALKPDMVDAAREQLGYTGASHDAADALWLRAIGLDLLGKPIVDLPTDTHRSAIARYRGAP